MKKIIIAMILIVGLSVNAKELQTVFSYSTPPYVFKDDSGIVIDIVRESLEYKKHTMKPVFVNIGRSFEMFKNGYVDATTIIKKTSGLKAYYSEYFMQYHNAVFVLPKNNIKIQKLSDLSNYHFSSFQNAKKYLGEEFGKIAINAKDKYTEVADQEHQVYKFLMGRTEATVMDRHIFKFYKNMLIKKGKIDKNIKVEMLEFFEPTKYRAAFREKSIRDDFNEGLEQLRKSGRYDEIYDNYSKKYFEVKE